MGTGEQQGGEAAQVHSHAHTHEHTHSDGSVHTHEHSHTHTHGCGHDACGSDHAHSAGHTHEHSHGTEHTPREELTALLRYMVGHNASHVRETAELAERVKDENGHVCELITEAVSILEQGNSVLAEALRELEKS